MSRNYVELLSQKLYNNCDMKTELKELILKRIKGKNGLKVFSCFDFTDLAAYKAISKCLERLEDEKTITRVAPGIYCLTKFDNVLNIYVLPSIHEIVQAIARKNRWEICPTGNAALNLLGLDTQVVAKHVYLTSGPYKEYTILKNHVSLRKTMSRELGGYSELTNLLIQCIKAIGEDRIEDEQIECLKRKLTNEQKKQVIKETTLIPTWIRNITLKICEAN